MAAWAVTGVPAAMAPVTIMSAAASSKGEKKGGPFDWLNGAFEKDGLSETDPILQKVEGATPPPRPSAAPKKASPPKKQAGGGFFGLGKK